MNNGPSRELLELWAPDPRNGVIMTGYSIEGTMARVSGYAVFPGASSGCGGLVYDVFLYVYHRKTMYHVPHPSTYPPAGWTPVCLFPELRFV